MHLRSAERLLASTFGFSNPEISSNVLERPQVLYSIDRTQSSDQRQTEPSDKDIPNKKTKNTRRRRKEAGEPCILFSLSYKSLMIK